MSCKSETGLDNVCDPALGGLNETFWAGYLSELQAQIPSSQVSDISSIDFDSGGYLRRFTAQKNSHSFGVDLMVESKRRKHWIITFNPKIISSSVLHDVTIQNLLARKDIFFIVQNNNRQFFILGSRNGMRPVSGDQNTGNQVNSDVSDIMSFAGIEKTKPLRFSVGNYQGTLNLLEEYEVPGFEFIPPTFDSTIITFDSIEYTFDNQ